MPLVIGKPSVIEGYFQMRFSKFSILTLFGYPTVNQCRDEGVLI